MAPTKQRTISPGMFYAGLTLAALAFFISLNSILQAGLQAFLSIEAAPITIVHFFELGSLPVGIMLTSGVLVLLMMHKEVKWLEHKRLDFNAPGRLRGLYALAGICVIAGALYIAHLIQAFYDGTLQPYQSLYTLVALWVVIHGPVMARFSTSSPETVMHWGWLRSVSVLLGMGLGLLIVHTYFSPANMQHARQDITKIQMLERLQMRNLREIRTTALKTFLSQATPPETIYISKDGETIQENAAKGLGPFGLKVISGNTCEICADIHSPTELRARIAPFNPRAKSPKGEVCFKIPRAAE